MTKLEIKDLYVKINDHKILKGLSLKVQEGEIHAIMGPNGNGKSTLLSAIMGHPRYEVTDGEVLMDDQDLLEMEVNERSLAGLFLGMQYPQEVPGVSNADFLKSAINTHCDTPIGLYDFVTTLESNVKLLRMKEDLAHRYLNEGFSGGEKKRNEILQMLMLKPKIAMLDEIDSGLDIDALALVAQVLKEEQEKTGMGLLIVSHYERFFELLQPTHVHIMLDGKIVLSGDHRLVTKIDSEGYDWLSERGIEDYIKENGTIGHE